MNLVKKLVLSPFQNRKMKFKRVFVTVGTTEFDDLVEIICSAEVSAVLKSSGCQEITIQYGNGKQPDIIELGSRQIHVHAYRLKASILEDIQCADLVISHAGAGSCIEILREQKPCLVVVNEELMGNHQIELAEQLAKDGHLFYCTTKELPEALKDFDASQLVPYERGNPKEFLEALNELMGVK